TRRSGPRTFGTRTSASPPPWLGHLRPETLPVDADGRRPTYGSRNQFCPSAPAYRERALGAELARQGEAAGARVPARAALVLDWASWWAVEGEGTRGRTSTCRAARSCSRPTCTWSPTPGRPAWRLTWRRAATS
ncbi:MAG TPA: beta-galactosidase, partial [Candidatus Dormibacteraeota bacterium]|nr:beta-galactosidase [Candidatus Dormibacteraeota bacterium]